MCSTLIVYDVTVTKTSVCIRLNHISGSQFTTSAHNFLGKNSIRAQSAARCRAGRAVGAPGGIVYSASGTSTLASAQANARGRGQACAMMPATALRAWETERMDGDGQKRMQGWSHAEGREGRSNVLLSLALSEDELWINRWRAPTHTNTHTPQAVSPCPALFLS